MKNFLVAKILEELAAYTEMEDDEPYRARAYRRAAQTIESYPDPIEDLWRERKLQEVPGVGENIEKKIDEILRTGKLQTLEKIKSKTPVDVSALTKVEGIGPKTVRQLHEQLGINTLDDFEAAVREGKLHGFRGLGVKSDEALLQRISNAKLQSSRILLAQAVQLSKRVDETLKQIPNVHRYAIAGSFRRMKETIGDFDVLIETDEPAQALEYFTRKSRDVKEVMLSGDRKASVRLQESNFQVDARVIAARSWGAALLYFTGSKSHNIELRTIAIKKGFRLNEYGLFMANDETEMVAGKSEEEVYSALGMDYIEPELRENRGEIQAAMSHSLPNLVKLKDIRGDLQMHTESSDGRETIEAMSKKAVSLGYEYIAITDHIGALKIANAMDPQKIRAQRKKIDSLNEGYEKADINFHVIQGAEVNIKSDGKLDMPDSVLKEIELVLASIHSGFSDDSDKITKRITSAMENENVDIIAHPTGRLIFERSGYQLDLHAVIEKALETETILEIDGHPNRLDLNDENAREVVKAGALLSVDTDSHESGELEYMDLGVAQARRAWAEKKDILNTRSHLDVMNYLSS